MSANELSRALCQWPEKGINLYSDADSRLRHSDRVSLRLSARKFFLQSPVQYIMLDTTVHSEIDIQERELIRKVAAGERAAFKHCLTVILRVSITCFCDWSATAMMPRN